MTAPLPSIDEPPAGTCCPKCRAEIRVENFCPGCFEAHLQAREALIERDLAEARSRAHWWRLSRTAKA